MNSLCSVRSCNQPSCREAAAPFCARHWAMMPDALRRSLWAMVGSMYDTMGEEPGESALHYAVLAAATRVELLDA